MTRGYMTLEDALHEGIELSSYLRAAKEELNKRLNQPMPDRSYILTVQEAILEAISTGLYTKKECVEAAKEVLSLKAESTLAEIFD